MTTPAQSPAYRLRRRGFGELTRHTGEALTIGGVTVRGVVRRDVMPDGGGENAITTEQRQSSEIEIRKSIMPHEARTGESFLDSMGDWHRVLSVGSRGLTWVYFCELSPGIAEEGEE